MMYLIDTDILIYSLKGDPVVMDHLDRTATSAKAISVISYGELLYGGHKSARPNDNLARVRRLGEVLPVIDVSPAIMESFGSLKAQLESDGQRLDDFDLVIAATAITIGYRLVTNNEKHFSRIEGLEIENWART
ncbi:MAG: type II toxin-antitoxin system VapC family toxin [Deltaproteobacteria bacterium]|nr:type II toxin-antitoxin system VapC family toxin [Deltaproteobacteria bacterium]